MANLNIALLAMSVFIAGCIVILFVVGTFSVRSGLRTLPHARDLGQEPVWHKQPNILFGFNNFAFALLLTTVLLFLLLTDISLKGIVAGLGVCLLVLSVSLVARSILYSLRAAKNLRNRQTKNP